MFSRLNHHFEFDTHFDKTLKNQAFHHFSHHQKSPLSTQKSSQTLVKSTFLRTYLKFSKIHTNYSKQNTNSTSISPTKIKYFPQSDHLKITLLPNPSKFTPPIQTSNQSLSLPIQNFLHSSHTQIEKYIT